ncbi:hypothetical protein EDD37DRAFT_116589 [Exophiala viscosa]|uniref:uncharacterized protein n=1 Tax=Exophiala viscosa TaxID=2486360 RepID=UPI002198BE66|nr:hypothetical protein EDD37DRAFT_116589 [Exophiala viscosa]
MAPLTYPVLPLRTPRHWKRQQKWISGVGLSHGVGNYCTCGKHHPKKLLSMCVVFPRHKFGSSRFNTIVLLVLRLFYHASSFEATPILASGVPPTPKLLSAPVLRAFDVETEDCVQKRHNREDLPQLLKSYERLSTKDWKAKLLEDTARFQHWKICNISWIKALASPFSHEFLQFIAEDAVTGQRTRIAAGREENGDWVLVGWNWASGQTPSEHYKLPLPLLSLVFDKPKKRPNMHELAEVLAATTDRGYYRMRREMCWWYAETVLEDMNAKYGGSIKEWQWARYRYSFIVKTSFIRRKVLTKHAEAFKTQLAEEMSH